MNVYKHVLLAIDFHPIWDKGPINRAMTIAKECQATLSIVHAVEHVHPYGADEPRSVLTEIEATLIDDSKTELAKIADHLGIATSNQFVKLGQAHEVILETAQNIQADLIIMSNYGGHGIEAVFGSTASAVLHHARCDVLVVRENIPATSKVTIK